MENLQSTPPDLVQTAMEVTKDLMPKKSKERYLVAYENFMKRRRIKNTESFSENVLLAYFKDMSSTYKPSSLWSMYSMLKTTLNLHNDIDIAKYLKLIAFLKKCNVGFRSKKSRILTAEEVEKYLNEAPDHQNLATKVGLIFGINGACRREEMCQVETQDVRDFENSHILVNIPNTKTHIARSFITAGKFYDKVKQYMALRPQNCKTNRFFLNYQNGKCTHQPIGKEKFGKMPKSIALYLNLPQPELYTGHSFRRTSATLLADSGANITTIKRHGGWKSGQVAETYIEGSVQNKKRISEQITENIQIIDAESSSCSTKVKTIPQNFCNAVLGLSDETHQINDPNSSLFTTGFEIIPENVCDTDAGLSYQTQQLNENITNFDTGKNVNLTLNNCSNITFNFHAK